MADILNLDEETQETETESEQEKSDDGQDSDQEQVDYKKKFSESTREAQIQASKVKELEKKLQSFTNTDVTEAELRESFGDWDEMTYSQQELAKRNLVLEKKFNAQQSYVADLSFKEEQEKSLKEVFARNPQLRDKEDEFRGYISKKSHAGTPINILANAFMYETSGTPKSNKGSALQTGRGSLGIREVKTSKKNALSQGARDIAEKFGINPDEIENEE